MSTKGKSSVVRRALKVVGALLLLLILLVVFAPTLAGMALVRHFAVGRINDHLNGSVEIDDWSLGWTTGATVSGIRVYDDHKRLILKLPHVKTGLTLLSILRGNYDVGDATADVELTDCRIDAAGNCNYAGLVKASPPVAPSVATGRSVAPAAQPVLSLTGSFAIRGLCGSITDDRWGHVVHLDPASTAGVKLVSLAEPIHTSLNLVYRVDQAPAPSTITTTGTVCVAPLLSAVDANFGFSLQLAAAMRPEQQLTLDHADLGPLTIILRMSGLKLSVAGVADGIWSITQAPQTDAAAQTVSLVGHGTISKLNAAGIAADGTRRVLAEDQLVFADDLIVHRDSSNLDMRIKTLTLDMQSSDALHLAAGGGVGITDAAYTFDKLRLDVTGDLAKLWTSAQGVLSKKILHTIGDVRIVGNTKRSFFVDGSYSRNAPMRQAIAGLTAYGTIGADRVDLDTHGVHLKAVDIPVCLRAGHLRIAYGDRAAGADAPPSFTANGGTMDLGGGDLDLTAEHPTLNWAENHQLVRDFQLNEIAVKLLRNASPVFSGATEATGPLDLTIVSCRDLPIDESLGNRNCPGHAELGLSVRDLHISGGFWLTVIKIAEVMNQVPDVLQGDVNGAKITISGGHVRHELAIVSADGSAMNFDGDMRIADDYYERLDWQVPGRILALNNVPYVTFRFTGPSNKLKLDPKTTLGEIIKAAILQGILGGSRH